MKLQCFPTINIIQVTMEKLSVHKRLYLFIILAIAAYLRFQGFGSNFIFSDIGRDMLVAKHIAYGWSPAAGIAPNSSFKILPQTPVYYRLLAYAYSVVPNPIYLQIIHALISLSLVYIAYKIGLLVGNYTTGIMCSLCVAVSPILVFYARGVFQFTLIPVFICLSLYYLFRSLDQSDKRRAKYLIMSILCFTPALVLHHVSLSLWPFFLLSWYFCFIKSNMNIALKFMIFAASLCQILLFVYLIGLRNGFLYIFFNEFIRYSPQQYFMERLKSISSLLFWLLNTKYEFVLSVIFWLVLNLIHRNKIKPEHVLLYIAGISSFIITIFLPFTIFHTHYLTPVYIIIPLLFATNLWSQKRGVYSRILGSLLTIMFIFHSFQSTGIKYISSSKFSFSDSQLIASAIVSKSVFIKNNAPFNIILPLAQEEKGIPRISDWWAGSIWYALEEKMNRRLVNIVPASVAPNNIMVPEADNRYILLCADDPDSDFLKNSVCLADWTNNYGFPLKQIASISAPGVTYHLYETN